MKLSQLIVCGFFYRTVGCNQNGLVTVIEYECLGLIDYFKSHITAVVQLLCDLQLGMSRQIQYVVRCSSMLVCGD